jgi:predicted transposase/invertase (TIGR01784 family)
VVFKKIFGDHPHLLISFLNAVLPLEPDQLIVELPKFPVRSSGEKQLRLLWLRFLREIDEKTTTVSKELLDVPEIAEAITLAKESAYTPGKLIIYESYWDQVSREKTLMIDKFAEGEARGRINEKYEITINLLKCGIDINTVIKSTGLTREEVEKIKSST